MGGGRLGSRGPCARVGLVGLACALAAMSACKGGSRADRIRRTSDTAPVQVVTAGEGTTRPRSNVAEREPNDQAAQANDLALEALARGRIEAPSDTDRYRVTLAKAGMLTVTVTGVPLVDLVLELRDARTDAVLARSDRGGAKVDEGVGAFAVAAGAYDVVVRAFVKAPAKPKGKAGKRKAAEPTEPPASASPPGSPAGYPAGYPSEDYELTASLVEPAPGNELEPNYDSGTASDLTIGDRAAGLVGWAGDVDVWKLSTEVLAANNALDVELSGVDGVALQLELRDGLGRTVASRKAGKGQPLAVHGYAPGEQDGAPPFLYVVISGDRSHPQQAYQLTATAREAGAEDEREGNDGPQLAQSLGEEGARLHATWDQGDVDCFAVPVADDARRVEVTVEPAEPAPGAVGGPTNLVLEVLVADKVVASSDEPGGKAERALAEVPAGKRAVVRVKGASKPGAHGRYDVSWAQAEGDAMPPEEPGGAGTSPAR